MNKELDVNIMDEWLTKLKETEKSFDERKQISTPKIQRVPNLLRQNDRFAKYCIPKCISFGPIHHKDPRLKQGEEFKLLWTSKFVTGYSRHMKKDTNQATHNLFEKIKGDMEELKKLYAEDAILEGGYDDNCFTWMLFVDGCSALYFMDNVDIHHPEVLNIKFDKLMYIWRDMHLLENQLPMRLLKLLSESGVGNLNYSFFNFEMKGDHKCKGHSMHMIQPYNYDAIHILDHFRLLLIGLSMEENIFPNQDDNLENITQNTSEDPLSIYTYKNIRDLKAIGIEVKRYTTGKNPQAWSNVHLSSNWLGGVLRLPMFVFNDNTLYIFRNLLAYEMCPDNFCHKYECCSFFSFMDSLIDNVEDVKELRLSGTLINMLSSDEDLANFINELGDDLPTKLFVDIYRTPSVAFSAKYINVKQQIEKHYSTKWRRWVAQGYNTYFGSPWSIIAFLAALVALVLTFIQTWLTIHPKH
ncbi:hypothetical protein Fmac_023236 [Flemingia macrophylla]|uniref:Uncharacterized protein n=1 Tax=Flemingia macrophylla TaxID=520843 RepID=A0ABD1LKX4_9FABA